MNFQQGVRTVLSNYATFTGRARRAEYWWWVLFLILANAALGILDAAFFGRMMMGMQGNGPLSAVFSLLTLLPGIAVAVRRLHDIDRSGWWMLLVFVPLIGWIVLLVWACTLGTAGPNRFGTDPVLQPQSA